MVAWVFSLLTTGSCFMVRSYGVTGSPGIVQYRQPQLSVTVCRVRGFWSSLFTQPCPVLTIYCVISWSGLWCICLDLLFSLLWYCGAVVLYNYISESHVSSPCQCVTLPSRHRHHCSRHQAQLCYNYGSCSHRGSQVVYTDWCYPLVWGCHLTV